MNATSFVMVTEMKETVKANDLKVGDKIEVFPGKHGTGVVTKVAMGCAKITRVYIDNGHPTFEEIEYWGTREVTLVYRKG